MKGWEWVNANPEVWAQKIYVEQYHLSLADAQKLVKAGGGVKVLQLPGDLIEPQQALADRFYDAQDHPQEDRRGHPVRSPLQHRRPGGIRIMTVTEEPTTGTRLAGRRPAGSPGSSAPRSVAST